MTESYKLFLPLSKREVNIDISMPKNNVLLNDLRIRKLTPKECWRLQGFDDGSFEKASKVCSNAQLYKQAGNSIVVNVLEAILKRLLIEQKENPQLSLDLWS